MGNQLCKGGCLVLHGFGLGQQLFSAIVLAPSNGCCSLRAQRLSLWILRLERAHPLEQPDVAAGDFREHLRKPFLGYLLFTYDTEKALDGLYIQFKTPAEDIDPRPLFSLLGEDLSYYRSDRRFSWALFDMKAEVMTVERADIDDGSGPETRRRLYFFSMVSPGGL